MKKMIGLAFCFALGFWSCQGPSNGTGFWILGSNLSQGQVIPLNAAIELYFTEAVDFSTVNLSSIAIFPEASSAVDIPPVVGNFYIKPNSQGKTLLFQPRCPLNSNDAAGFVAASQSAPIFYTLCVSADSPTSLRSQNGEPLRNSLILQFQTPSPPASLYWDMDPDHPPRIQNLESLPKNLGINRFLEPIAPILLEFDQSLNPESIQADAIRLEFLDPRNQQLTRIPAELFLAANCLESGGAQLYVIPKGILPMGEEISFWISTQLKGLGFSDSYSEDFLFHRARVLMAETSPTADAFQISFENSELLEEETHQPMALAKVESGSLRPATLFSGNDNEIEIEIGPGTNNPNWVHFSTDGDRLYDKNGNLLFFENGIINVRRFVMKSPLPGGFVRMKVSGSKPLQIRAREQFLIEKGAWLCADGIKGGDALGFSLAQFPVPGAPPGPGGGRGGDGSPNTAESDLRGGNGAGPGNIPNAGGRGAYSGYGDLDGLPYDSRPGGGGGGNWGVLEKLQNESVSICYGSDSCTDCSLCPSPCEGVFPPSNSQGEAGNSGVALSRDAGTGLPPARGAAAGPAIFSDNNSRNNFWGRKPNGLSVLQGELISLQGGQGGGAGGDNIPGANFPSGDSFFTSDLRGGSGGGGGGAIRIQSLGSIVIEGKITADGGDGGAGETMIFEHAGAGGGGGGAGGMICLESDSAVWLGTESLLSARGGDRGPGGGNIPGTSGSPNYCKKANNTASRGGAGGKGLIQISVPYEQTRSYLSDCDGDGTMENSISNNALLISNAEGEFLPVLCESDELLRLHSNPAPVFTILPFGRQSAVLSKWLSTGFASLNGPVQFGSPSWEAELLSENQISILFEAADETETGSGIALESSRLGPTNDLNLLSGKTLIRFLLRFEMNVEGTEIRSLQIPYWIP